MLVHPKLDKLSFTIKKKDMLCDNLERLLNYLEVREDVNFNNSPRFLTIHITPTKLIRPNLTYDDTMKHNLQMDIDLIVKFFEELEQFYIYAHNLNILNLHIAKDRVMENTPQDYYLPLVDNQTRFKGRVRAFMVNNGTTPSVHICNDSDSMNRGEKLIKNYDKSKQLQDHLKVQEITPLEPLAKDEIKMLGKGYSKYTGRINLEKVNLMRNEIELKDNGLLLLPHTGSRLRVIDILTMIKEDTLYDNLDKTYKSVIEKALFPQKKEATKDSALDRFIVADSMHRFDSLFMALGKYQAYKEYTNSIITKDDKLLEEMYDKFM